MSIYITDNSTQLSLTSQENSNIYNKKFTNTFALNKNLTNTSNHLFSIIPRNTDIITIGTSNRFITNDNYNRNIYFSCNVGIGISTPAFNLDVNGNINFTGSLYQNGNIFTINTSGGGGGETTNTSNNSNLIGYNTTVVDITSFQTSNIFNVNSNNYTNTHECSYTKIFEDSELVINASFPYTINGYGSDEYSSRLEISSSDINANSEYSQENKQVFIGYAAGGGTRSGTLSPIYYKTNISGSIITIKVQIKLVDANDSIDTSSCLFTITEKKPSSKLKLTSYLNITDLPIIYSNVIKWNSSPTNENNIYYSIGNVGIGKSNPSFNLDVNGDINFTSNLKLNGCNLPFSFYTNTNVSASNAYFSYINNCNDYAYYQFLIDGSIRFPQITSCDLICVGAGGNGGFGAYSGGGGAGEVIVYPNFNFNSNINYNIQVGLSSFNSNLRISKITSNQTDLIRANGGGNGGSFILNTTYNCNNVFIPTTSYLSYNYDTPISINSGTYNISFNSTAGAINVGSLTTNNSYSVLKDTTGNIIQPDMWLKFDNSANIAFDTIGNSTINTVNTLPVYSTSAYVKGSGSAFFDVAGNALSYTYNLNLSTINAFTISFWIKLNRVVATWDNILSIYTTGGTRCIMSRYGDGGIKLYVEFFGTGITYSGEFAANNTLWKHYVFIIEKVSTVPTVSFYKNGTLFTGSSTSTGTWSSTTNSSTIQLAAETITSGVGGTNGYINLDDFRIYKRALTATQIQELYNGRVSIYTSPERGGSSGGTYINSSNVSIGTSFNPGYSNMTAGSSGTSNMGGNGGSATLTGGLVETITSSNLIVGIGGNGATSNSVPNILNETFYGSGGDGNGGLGTQGVVIVRVPLNIQKPLFNGYIDYNNIENKPYINTILNSKELIDVGYFNQINFPMANAAWANEWFLYMGLSPSLQSNSFIFWHNNSNSGINSKWWFNGTIANTNNEISDFRIKKEITDIQNPLDKLMSIKPKEYYLCDDKDYLKKYGIIAQDIKEVIPEFVYTDTDYIANVYSKCSYVYDENNRNLLILPSEITISSNINVNDELKLLLNNNNGTNQEIIIEDLPYHNRYKKRFVKVKEVIDERTIEINEKLELTEIEKNNLFIYGKKTEDFLKLDYSSIYTLNVASTQELVKKITILENMLNTAITRIEYLESNININK